MRRTLLLSTTTLMGLVGLAGTAHAQPIPPPPLPAAVPLGPSATGATVGAPVANGGGGFDLNVSVDQNRAVIDWLSFNIGSASEVRFTDGVGGPGNRFVLNRDVNPLGAPSQVYGRLTSDPNVAVYLLNSNGVLFGNSANVNVGSLVASSLGITNADFLAGNIRLTGSGMNGVRLLSGGTIATTSGSVAFVGSRVDVAGPSGVNAITATGDVALVAAHDVTLALDAGSPLSVTIHQGTTVSNAMTVAADVEGRNIYLAVASRASVTNALLNVSGDLEATGVAADDRGVVLVAGRPGGSGVTVAAGGGNDTNGGASISIAGDIQITAPNVRFAGAVNGVAGADLTVDATTSTRFDQAVGAGSAVASVTVNGAGTTTIAGGDVRTTGGQSYAGPVSLTADTTLTSTGSGDINLNGAVNSANALTVATAGETRFGGVTSVRSLATDAGGTTRIAGGTMLTTGTQNYGDAVLLDAATAITSTGTGANGAINFASTLDGTQVLTVSTAGTARFNGAVGSITPLQALNTTGGGSALINGGGVATTQRQTYNNTLLFGADATLSSTGAGAAGNIWFLGAVGGTTADVTINTAGETRFASTASLASLTTDMLGTTRLTGGSILTSGNQRYGDNLVLGAATALTGANLTFDGAITGNQVLTVNAPGVTRFNGTVSVAQLSTASGQADPSLGTVQVAGGAITTTGTQTYNNDLVLAADAVLTSTGAGAAGAIIFNDFVDGAFGLTVTTAGTTSFNARVGAVAPLASLTVNGGGATRLAGLSVNTTGNQIYTDNLLLVGNLTLTGATPTFGGDVTGDGSNLALNFTGETRISGTGDADATDFANIRNLSTGGGGTTVLTGTIVTSGSQVYGEDIRLDAATILQGTGATIGVVDGNAQDLTLNFSGAVTLDGDDITQVDDFVTGNGGTTNISGTLTTLGAQTHGDNLALIGDTLLASSGNADIALGRVTGAFALTVNTSGVTRLTGAVGGGAGSLTTLTTNAGGTTLITGGAVTTTGDQLYGDAVQLGADTFIAGDDVTFDGAVSSSGANRVLTVSAPGVTRFNGAVGTLAALNTSGGTADPSAGTVIIAGGAVTTSGAQDYSNDVSLASDAILTSTGGGALTFRSTVDGPGGLDARTTGITSLIGSVGGGGRLAFLTTDAGGETRIGGAFVRTTGNQSYGDLLVLLGATATLDGATPTFGGIVRGTNTDLTLTFTGDTRIVGTLPGNVQNFTGFTRLTTNGGGRTALSGNLAIADQVYGDLVVLAGDTSLNGVNGSFALGVDGNGFDGTSYDLALNFSGDTILNGSFVDINDLSTGGGGVTRLSGSILTTGAQTYGDAVLLANDATLDSSGNGDIAFQSTVDGGFNLIVSTGGTTIFTGQVGGATPLLALRLDGGGESRINGGLVETTGDQLYFDDIRLGADTVLRGAAPTFAGDVFGDGFDLLLRFSGTTRISGTGDDIASDFTGIRNLESSSGGLTLLAGTIETSGSQIYNDGVELIRNTTLTAGGGVSFDTLDSAAGAARSLLINSPANTFFGGEVGAVRQLGGLTTDAAGTTQVEFSIRSTSTTINDPLDLVGAGVQRISGGDVTLASVNAFDPAGTLSINTLRGGVFQSATFGGRIDVENLAVNAGAVSFAGVDNSVGTLAVSATSGFIFQNDRNLLIASVDGVNGLTATGAASDVQVRVTGTLDSTQPISVGRDLILVSTAAMTLGADVTAGRDLTVNGQGVVTTLAALQAGGVIAIDADDGDATLGSLTAPTGISIFDAANVTLGDVRGSAVPIATASLTLGGAGDDSITGNVTQSAGSTINVDTLTGNVAGDVVLANTDNLVGALGAFNAANLSLRDNAGGMLINGDVTVPGRLVLSINGALTQTGGEITTGDLFATTVGGARLETFSNRISVLSGFTNVGAGGVRLNNFIALRITDSIAGNVIVDSGTGELRITGPGIDFNGEILRAGGNLELIGANAFGFAGDIVGDELRADGTITVATFDRDIAIRRAVGADNPQGAAASIGIGQQIGTIGSVSLGEGRATGLILIVARDNVLVDSLTSLGGNINVGAVNGSVTDRTPGTLPELGDLFAGGDISISSGQQTVLNSVVAGGDVNIVGGAAASGDAGLDNIDINTVAGRDVALRTARGGILIETGRARDDFVIRSNTTATVTTIVSSGVLADGSAAPGENSAGRGDALATLIGGSVDTTSDVLISSVGAIDIATATAAGNLTLVSDASVAADNLNAAGRIDVGAPTINVSNAVGLAGAPDSRANLITMTASNGPLTLGTARSATDIVLTATNGLLTLNFGDALGNILLDGNDGAITGAIWEADGRIDAQGDLGVSVGIATALGGTAAANTILLRSASGGVTLDNGVANGNLILDAASDVRVGFASSIAGNIDVDAGGEVTGLMLPDGSFDRGNLLAQSGGGDIDVTAGGRVLLATADANGDLRITSAAGGLDIVTGLAGGLIDIDVALVLIADRLGANSSVTGRANSMDINTIAGLAVPTPGNGSAAAAIDLTATIGALRLGFGRATGDARITAATDIRIGSLTSLTGDILITGRSIAEFGGDTRSDLFAPGANGDIIVNVGRRALLGAVAAGRDVDIVAGTGAGADAAIDNIDVTTVTGRDVALRTTAGGVRVETGRSRDDFVIRSATTVTGTGVISSGVNADGSAAGGANSAGSGDALAGMAPAFNVGTTSDLLITSAGVTDLVTATAAGSLTLVSDAAVRADDLNVAGAISVRGADIDIGSAVGQTGGDSLADIITMTSTGGAIVVGEARADGLIDLTSNTDVRAGTLFSGTGGIDIAAGGEVTGLATDGRADLITDAGGGAITVAAAGIVRLGLADSSGNLDIDSTAGGIDITDGRAAGFIDLDAATDVVLATGLAGGNARVDAGNDARIGTLTSGGAIDIDAGRDVLGLTADGRANLIIQGAGTNIDVTAGRDALLNSVTARANLTVDANRLAGLGATSGVNVRVTADNLDLTGVINATTLIELTNRAAANGGTGNDTFLGDGAAPATAFALSAAEVNRLVAPTVNILSGIQNVGIGNVQIGDNVGATRLRLLGTGRFDVFGTLQTGTVAGRTLQIGGSNIAADQLTPANLSNPAFVQANLASAIVVRIAATNGGALILDGGTLDLRGQRIAAGNAGNLLADLGLIGGTPLSTQDVAQQFVSQPNSSLYFEPAGGLPGVFLRADSLTVSYSEFAVFQNTAIAGAGGLSSGAVIGGRVPGQVQLNTTGSAATNAFALFGEINDQIANGAALLGEPPLFISTTNLSNTRINGCLVGSGGGGCLISAVNPPRVDTVPEDQVNILTADEAALQVDPLVGTSNEALLTDCEADPTAEQCPAEEQP